MLGTVTWSKAKAGESQILGRELSAVLELN